MTPEQRQQIETQIQSEFSELQKKLKDLQNEVRNESDENKKQEKEKTIQEMEKKLSDMKTLIDTLSSLQEEALQSLKNTIEQTKQLYDKTKGETADLLNEKTTTPTTYELLKDSDTCIRIRNIIASNPKEFKNIPGDSPEAKLEYIFSKIRNGIVLFLKNKLGDSERCNQIINETIAPAFEYNLLELLRDQGNETNVSMLKGMDKISRDNFNKLVTGVGNFAKSATGSYDKFSSWMNAIDYLSIHNGVLLHPEKSAVLSNPLEFQAYLNDSLFSSSSFSPYATIDTNIFKVDDSQTFGFGMSLDDKQKILGEIGNIQVVNNPRTTALIAKMIDKPEKFLGATAGLQTAANALLNGLNSINPVAKILGVDIIGEIAKLPEKRGFLFKIIDFVCKLIGITGGLEGIVRRRRLDKLNLTDEKNSNIKDIFDKYHELVGEGISLSITDENSCKTALADFGLTDLDKSSSSKGDHLRDTMAENMDISQISPVVVQQTLGNSYIKKETSVVNGKKQEKILVDESKFTDDVKREFAHKHIMNMKSHLESNYKDLKDFYATIKNTDDIAICMTASLYADKNDVIEGVKAKVFLPENYCSVHSDGTVENGNVIQLSELTSEENIEMQNLVEQSKTPNTLCYLENSTYKKYLNIIERDLKLPKYALECVCKQESFGGYLYKDGKIIGSHKGAQGLFQFMPTTADSYMKHKKLKEKYGKTFTSRDEFLKDPLASAWAAGILYSEFINNNNYNFQSALACYNRGIGNYQGSIGGNGVNLSSSNFTKVPQETKKYIEIITKDVLQHNSVTSNDVLSVDLSQYLRQEKDLI